MVEYNCIVSAKEIKAIKDFKLPCLINERNLGKAHQAILDSCMGAKNESDGTTT